MTALEHIATCDEIFSLDMNPYAQASSQKHHTTVAVVDATDMQHTAPMLPTTDQPAVNPNFPEVQNLMNQLFPTTTPSQAFVADIQADQREVALRANS